MFSQHPGMAEYRAWLAGEGCSRGCQGPADSWEDSAPPYPALPHLRQWLSPPSVLYPLTAMRQSSMQFPSSGLGARACSPESAIV